MPVKPEDLHNRLSLLFPDATIFVEDTRGDMNHYDVTIISQAFSGLTPIQQHRLVYEGLGDWVGNEIHALSLNTSVGC